MSPVGIAFGTVNEVLEEAFYGGVPAGADRRAALRG